MQTTVIYKKMIIINISLIKITFIIDNNSNNFDLQVYNIKYIFKNSRCIDIFKNNLLNKNI